MKPRNPTADLPFEPRELPKFDPNAMRLNMKHLTPQQEEVKKENKRRSAAADRLLAKLRLGPAINYELVKPEYGGINLSGRVSELRVLGYVIQCDAVKGKPGQFLYTLISEPGSGERDGMGTD